MKEIDLRDIQFCDSTASPHRFWSILPPDWCEEIEPMWSSYPTANIYTLETDAEVVGGGILFRTVSPDTAVYFQFAQAQFDAGYEYLAYIWIDPAHRGKSLGSEWLRHVHTRHPTQCFWLTIEDYSLVHFYERSSYKLGERLDLEASSEWVMRRKPEGRC
jgi:diamine N-acetyltransferase